MLENRELIFVCELDSKLIGSVRGRIIKFDNDLFLDKPILSFLEYLMVKKEFRGRSISTKLKNELFKYFKKNRVNFVRLEVINTNSAIESYKKWGFETDTIKMIKKI